MFRTLLLLLLAAGLAACRSTTDEADLAYAREDWSAAADLYSVVLEQETDAERIAHVKARLAESRERAAARHLERFRVLLAAGDVPAALTEGDRALGFAPSEELARELALLRSESEAAALATGLAAAERAAAERRFDDARDAFEALLASGADRDLVQRRVRAVIPADYQITLHSAVVLPMKPEVNWPWDGPHRAAIRDSDKLLVRLGALAGIEGFMTARLAAATNEFATSAYELPDCYPVVTFEGETWGGPKYARDEQLNPSWDLRLLIRATAEDQRVFELVVRDKDVSDDDTVGTWQIAVGEIVRTEGVREFVFVRDDGRLTAGGIVALKISVERFD